MKQLTIGLAGPARSGKTTCGDYLHFRHGFMDYAFAEPLKQAVAAILGISAPEVEEGKAKVVNWLSDAALKTPRELLQHLGTEFGRERVHPDLWVRATARRIERDRHRIEALEAGRKGSVMLHNNMYPGEPLTYTPRPFMAVITDVRFENEAQFIRETGGTILHIERTQREQVPEHASEKPIIRQPSDLIIDNSGDLSETFTQIDRAVQHLLQQVPA